MISKFIILFLLILCIILVLFLIKNNNSNKEHFSDRTIYYDEQKIKIGMIIPVTSNKRNYRNVKDIDFFNILLSSFLKTFDKSLKYQYNFYLGFDDDDKFYLKNKTMIISHFKKITKKYPVFKISLLKIDNLKGKLGEIWSRLADISVKNGDNYLYQLGDDIKFISSDWEDKFINKLNEFNNIGVVGPTDINNSTILTQSFVHKTHLDIFENYYPKEIKNWHIDNWITDVYKPNNYYMFNKIHVKNDGGTERYEVVVMKGELVQKYVSDGKQKINKYLDN